MGQELTSLPISEHSARKHLGNIAGILALLAVCSLYLWGEQLVQSNEVKEVANDAGSALP